MPATVAPGATSRVTTAPAPTIAPAPTRTPSPKATSSMSRYGASFAGASAIEERTHVVDDHAELLLRDPGEDRKREALPGKRLGDGELTRAVTKMRIRGSQVHWLRVVA